MEANLYTSMERHPGRSSTSTLAISKHFKCDDHVQKMLEQYHSSGGLQTELYRLTATGSHQACGSTRKVMKRRHLGNGRPDARYFRILLDL